MRAREVILIVICWIVASRGDGQTLGKSAYESALQSWNERFERSQRGESVSKSDLQQSFARMESAWSSLPAEKQHSLAARRWDAYRNIANVMVHSGEVAMAADYLRKEVQFSAEYSLLLTGRDPSHFEDLVFLQAEIAAKTGTDPLARMNLGYEFGTTSRGYYALRKEGSPNERQTDFKSVELPNLKDDETAGYFIELVRNEKNITLGERYVVALEVRGGGKTLSQRVRAVYSLGGFSPSGYGRPERLTPERIINSIRNTSTL